MAVIRDKHVSVATAAEMLGLSPYTVRVMLRRGELRGSKVTPRRWAIDIRDIRRFRDARSNQLGVA
ncbi:helix-turn-helix domain-containing protein [Corynebacterium xerosis]|uniref:helix-turn-helix domain-containing protein n=1 Tax=Corynebacterium xerosis TaxID=1725 RepID=UPI00364B22D4